MILLWILAILLVIMGFAGTVLPALPGAPLVFGGLFLIAWIEDFQRIGWLSLLILGLLTIFVLLVDIISTALGAKRVGASKLAIFGAALGTLLGIFLGLPGIVLGPFFGALIGEYIVRTRLSQAAKVGFATWLGLVISALIKLSVLFIMLGIFVVVYML
ncbi:MAG: DUF456 domain-containing protein [SAR324 cluster bacterium]|uniref:DUF456 domain-containing protein n=1 Tax=SAR324 cluster bacterium TaxID=2024889 RepID=A0A7X9IK60_9DELT|nr:DUF456 domain-containing protein [SAR324 cluster bacterium]